MRDCGFEATYQSSGVGEVLFADKRKQEVAVYVNVGIVARPPQRLVSFSVRI